jgi:membrane protein implicated in regulation of membrane protease activity
MGWCLFGGFYLGLAIMGAGEKLAVFGLVYVAMGALWTWRAFHMPADKQQLPDPTKGNN